MFAFRLGNPLGLLYLLIPVSVIVLLIIRKYFLKTGVYLSGVAGYKQGITLHLTGYFLALFLFLAGLFFVAFSLCSPQKGIQREIVTSKGIDIMIAFDMSTSMLRNDYDKRTRLDVAKRYLEEFINSREGDRIGIVTFERGSILRCPATLNRTMIINIVRSFKIEAERISGTAIGLGLASAINRLNGITDNENSLSKIILLITDGVNNMGEITPERATEIAVNMGYKIYTVALGQDQELDIELLNKIATDTGGRSYHVRNADEFETVFEEINLIEKHDLSVETFARYNDIGYIFASAGIIMIMLGLFLNLIFKRI